uniref:Uncharacterized protein n=1 Tax=Candidatus Kentrum sp. UNK TaxID=2126344 RepID=A0A451AZM3_9GAMM|nr:MAG: hypothetical protein BECKUNK1418G_GA0071005_106217 [Candidatus Kentron sp. UNK]VFK71483.1 MAG: hypothetical protein BECKUNK1418H_GA0071006_106817 [Candidatus Kentron sp. UNK]
MNRNPFGFSFFFVLLSILSSIAPAFAYAPLVTKQVFNMGSYTTVGGQTIPDVRIGWESYGTLNAAKDNVILIPPLLQLHQSRRRQVRLHRREFRLLGRHHRFRQGHRHGQVLCHLDRYAAQYPCL